MFYTNKIWLLNLALALLAVFIGSKTIGLWFSQESSRIAPETTAHRGGEELILEKQSLKPESFYDVIIQDNLFDPERKEIVETLVQKEPEKIIEPVIEEIPEVEELTIGGKDIFLYGILKMNDFTGALVNNFSGENPEKEQIWMEKGEIAGGLKLVEVEQDRAIFSRRENHSIQKYAVLLYSENKPDRDPPSKKNKKNAASETNVIRTGKNQDADRGAKIKDTKDTIDNDEYEIIKTPFGNFRRRKQ